MHGDVEALEHRTRRLIYNFITSNPGSSFGTIKDFLDLNNSTLKYHLNYLERTEKIESHKDGARRYYYCDESAGADPLQGSDPIIRDLNANQQKILNLIQHQPRIGIQDLMNYAKLNRKTIIYNLNKLIEHKLIWEVKTTNGAGYEYITKEKLRVEIYNRLLMRLLSDEIDEQTFLRIKRKLEEVDPELKL